MTKPPLTYAQSGVDIDAGNQLVREIAPYAARTIRPGADGVLGGFGGLFDLKAAGWDDPLLVAGTDGVGTKLDVAAAVGKHDSIGIDLVAMCVNDVLAQGAEPLFFLDYVATSRLADAAIADVVKGVALGCEDSRCALIGGETAEMPGLYTSGRYDLAGFCVGAVERTGVLPNHAAMQAGDVLIALASSGPHSNGFSLIRAIVDRSGLAWSDRAPWDDAVSMGEALLTPTRLYVRTLLPVMKAGRIKGAAHITGGGLAENPARMAPKHLSPQIDWDSWERPALFQWLQQAGNVDEAEMRRAFNCGVGMVVSVSASNVDHVIEQLQAAGETAWVCGEMVSA